VVNDAFDNVDNDGITLLSTCVFQFFVRKRNLPLASRRRSGFRRFGFASPAGCRWKRFCGIFFVLLFVLTLVVPVFVVFFIRVRIGRDYSFCGVILRTVRTAFRRIYARTYQVRLNLTNLWSSHFLSHSEKPCSYHSGRLLHSQ
jgi:hypothetical protein